jgi:hypothetical protein
MRFASLVLVPFLIAGAGCAAAPQDVSGEVHRARSLSGPAHPIPLPEITFELDPTFPCRVSETLQYPADVRIIDHLRKAYGVEVVASAAELATPGAKVKYLPDPQDARDGLMQLPQAVWEEAAALLPTYATAYDTSNPQARGTQLLRRMVEVTQTPFSFTRKTLPLYLCPNLLAAYNMVEWPFYPYLSTLYAPEDQAQRWTLRDWTDLYMLHELGHWFTFDQPYLRKWTPVLDRTYRQFSASDPQFLAGAVWVPATKATQCRDAYPDIYINMNNLLSHLHINGLRRTILEPDAWEYVKSREKALTGDHYYAASIDLVEAMPGTEVAGLLQEITDTRVPAGCSVLAAANQ